MNRLCPAVALASLAATGLAQTTWYVDGTNCTGSGSGSQSDPFCTIQEGVDASDIGDQIYVRAGVYVESVSVGGKSISLFCIDGPHSTVLRSSPPGVDPTLPAVEVGAGGTFLARRLTIRESRPGVRAMNATVVLEGCSLTENYLAPNGSSIEASAVLARDARVRLVDSTIADNRRESAISVADTVLEVHGSTLKRTGTGCVAPATSR